VVLFKTRTKLLKIKEINPENPENHFNLGINCAPASHLKTRRPFAMKKTLFIIAAVVAVYYYWATADRTAEDKISVVQMPEIALVQQGINSGKGNLAGIQPYLTAQDYGTESQLFSLLDTYMEALQQAGGINAKTVVVFPEYIGTWLVAMHEKRALYEKETITDAMTLMALSNLFQVGYHAVTAPPVNDRMAYGLFAMKAEKVCTAYQNIFSRLSKKYGCTIVAGSVVLPEPFIENGELRTKKGQLFNVTALFDANGKIMSPLVKKMFPISAEQGFTCQADLQQTPVFSTPAGRLAVLICADSWYPQAYESLTGKADLIAIPSLADTDSVWRSAWQGYNGFAAPADVDMSDYRRISEGEAWAKYSMGKRAPEAGIHQGINVFFTGDIWDMHPEGRILTLQNDSLSVSSPAIKKGSITNLWLK
jgi:predicted amidohydrolase